MAASAPKRTVGYDVSWDNIGPKLCAMGTITGENSGMAELASLLLNDINTFPLRCTAYLDPISMWITDPKECPTPKVGRSFTGSFKFLKHLSNLN